MNQLSLEHFTEVLVRSVNVRSENFGNDHVPAIDIGFRLTGSNKLLDLIDPEIRKRFYKAAPKNATQPELDGVEPLSDTPVRCLNCIEMPLSLNADYTGRNIVVDWGLGEKSNITLSGCDANNLKANLLEGGSVELDWRVQVSNVDADTIGKMGMLVKNKTKITMVASPESDNTTEKRQTPIDGTVGHPGLAKAPKAEKPAGPDAGELFAANEKAGKNKPAKAPAKTVSKKPSLKVVGRAKPRTGKGN